MRRTAFRFGWAGATTGLAVGALEGGLLYFMPRFSGLLEPDVHYVVWFLAPFVDVCFGGLLGLALGSAASFASTSEKRTTPKSKIGNLRSGPVLAGAFGLGVAGAYVGWTLDWFRIGAGTLFPATPGVTTWFGSFLAVFIVSLFLLGILQARGARFFKLEEAWPSRRWQITSLVVACGLVGGLIFYMSRPPWPRGSGNPSFHTDAIQGESASLKSKVQNPKLPPGLRPNIILIVLDTVRADHLSCYGYSRPTTPNLDRFARRGTLFEDAISSTSWTLPSLASIFTGLLPHQNGADWQTPLEAGPWTLARILRAYGYETAGFNANGFYGLAGWRLNEGFDVYIDNSYSVRHNLAATWIGQSVLKFGYDHLIRYNQFDHRNAADVNRDVFRWYAHRNPRRPYFLFINYMDAHRPYLPPKPYGHRFGSIPPGLFSKINAPLIRGHPSMPYTRSNRQEMIDGYDNSLAYLDQEIGKLFRHLGIWTGNERPGEGSRRTFVIVTADHGEGFGEHGTYDHGWNLYREVLHVPLIMEGPGIPVGLRIPAVVGNRQIFSTVLDLALPGTGPSRRSSLTRFWNSRGASGKRQKMENKWPDAVVSELVPENHGQNSIVSLSLTTPRWQYILYSRGRAQLFDLSKDPGEKDNLISDPSLRSVQGRLQTELEARIGYSVLPWYAIEYLTPLNRSRQSFVAWLTKQKEPPPWMGMPVGAVQAYFSHQEPSILRAPSRAIRNLLRSLPYD